MQQVKIGFAPFPLNRLYQHIVGSVIAELRYEKTIREASAVLNEYELQREMLQAAEREADFAQIESELLP